MLSYYISQLRSILYVTTGHSGGRIAQLIGDPAVGWANPVPINPYYYKDRKKGLILVSLAGPIANMLLACISILLEGLLLLYAPNTVFFLTLAVLFWYSAVLNVGLGVFNLIPIPPLDGPMWLWPVIPLIRK